VRRLATGGPGRGLQLPVRHEDPDKENFIAINVYLLYTVLASCNAPLYFDRVVPDSDPDNRAKVGVRDRVLTIWHRAVTCHIYMIMRELSALSLMVIWPDTSESLLSGWHQWMFHTYHREKAPFVFEGRLFVRVRQCDRILVGIAVVK